MQKHVRATRLATFNTFDYLDVNEKKVFELAHLIETTELIELARLNWLIVLIDFIG